MRILAITHLYPTPDDPAFAAFNRQQFARLAQLHDLQVVRPLSWPLVLAGAFRGRRGTGHYRHEDGILVHTPTYFYPPRIARQHYGTFFERSLARSTRSLIDTYRPDVILGSWAHPDGWAAVRIGRRAGIPVVVKVHGSDVLVHAVGARRARVAEALVGADAVVAVSEDLAAQVRGLGVRSQQIHVVPHGVDLARFTPGNQLEARGRLGLPPDGPLLLFVGRVLAAKGAADLVRACALVRDRGIAFRCRLVGPGADSPDVAALIRSTHLGEHVALVGGRPHAELPDWFRASDVVALPSHSEGIPNVLREAIAMRKPFVATRVGGIPEIADPSCSDLVPAGDIQALADALARMLSDPPRVDASLSDRINITWEQSASRLAELLTQVTSSRRTGATTYAAHASGVPA